MWKPDNYPSTGLSHSFLNWLSQSWTEVREKKKRKEKVTVKVNCTLQIMEQNGLFSFFLHAQKYGMFLLYSLHVNECITTCVCVCYTSPRGSGPRILVRRGEGLGCCRSAAGPGSQCRSWCCRETRKSRESTLRFYEDTQSNITLSHWWKNTTRRL